MILAARIINLVLAALFFWAVVLFPWWADIVTLPLGVVFALGVFKDYVAPRLRSAGNQLLEKSRTMGEQ